MCTCGPDEVCNVAASLHCSTTLIRITPQPWKVCLQTLKSYLASRPLKTCCKLDAKRICELLCVERENGLFEHKYDAVCNEISATCVSFQDVHTILHKHGAFLSIVSFRHFCMTMLKFSKLVFFHPKHRHLVCARGKINVYDERSLYESIQTSGSFGIALTELGGAYKGAGQAINEAIQKGSCVVVCNRIYSTSVAPLATPGALQQWLAIHHLKK